LAKLKAVPTLAWLASQTTSGATAAGSPCTAAGTPAPAAAAALGKN
jgi:hypothetical protein